MRLSHAIFERMTVFVVKGDVGFCDVEDGDSLGFLRLWSYCEFEVEEVGFYVVCFEEEHVLESCLSEYGFGLS